MTDYLVYSTVTSGKYGQAKVSNSSTSQVNMKGNLNTTGSLTYNGLKYGAVYKPEVGAGAGIPTGTSISVSSIHSSWPVSGSDQDRINTAFANTYGQTGWHLNTGTAYYPVSASKPAWIKIQFTSAKIISMYKIWLRSANGSRSPRTFELQGSNDGSNWDTLDSRALGTGSNNPWFGSVGGLDGLTFYNNTKIGSYTYYMIYITLAGNADGTNSGSDEQVNISEIGLFSCMPNCDSGFVSTDTSDCTFNGGTVGICVTDPKLLLHVGTGIVGKQVGYTGGFSSINTSNFTQGTGSGTYGGVNDTYSARFDAPIICNGYWHSTTAITYSDTRIKKDIVDVTDTEALDKLRLLKPKKYKYVDTVVRGESEVYGFIAQEVATVIPNSVSLIKNAIPDIFKIGIVGDDKKSITMSVGTTITQGDTLKLVDLNNTSVIVKVTEVVDTRNFKIDTNLGRFTTNHEGDEKIFVYGRQVEDFNSLNKSSIWTVATAALQEIDRQIQAENSKIEILEQELSAIKLHLNL